ncbi:Signal transduction histidine kinase [Herbaspirillum robiniae]|uniref:LapA family protein n=1 Tax=Herbaspirillum robiniae TaxID=2014887 RepID=A0A246WPR2_9BURK|nr:Signal transduction histidine kinase [Herbaspirillum robiniae]NUU01657.1 LapA family protein [Herbaspirillum robiniae]OWY28362.1 Signal transduction histidine kinase [Herbaspirillum robiniae]
MRFRTVFLIVLLVLVAIFAAVNWTAFTAPTTLSLIYSDFQAPLGAVMLGVVVVLTAFFLLYILALQTSVMLESRRLTKQLEAQRDLADQAEHSRFNELRGFLKAELEQLARRQTEQQTLLAQRLDGLQKDLSLRVEQTENAVAAQVGELDDRLQRHSVAGVIKPL